MHFKIELLCTLALQNRKTSSVNNKWLRINVVNKDQKTSSRDLLYMPTRPTTHARAKRIKEVINELIQELSTKEEANLSPNFYER